MKRSQALRKTVSLISFLLFPITINFFSPYLIMAGASEGIIAGSLVTFAGLFFFALFFGRAYCSWVCPVSTLLETCRGINDRRTTAKMNLFKYLIWLPWLLGILALAISAGGFRRLDLLYMTESGISMDSPEKYVVYYSVLLLFAGLALWLGRRAPCHTICWMAPFMVLGTRLQRLGLWPALRLKTDAASCRSCQRCTRVCPMSIEVEQLVKQNDLRHDECILCGECVDVCPHHAIGFTFSRGAKGTDLSAPPEELKGA